jgi:putative membrane protein
VELGRLQPTGGLAVSHRIPRCTAVALLACAAAAVIQAPAAGAVRPGVSAWDEQWLMMSIQGDRFEVAGGRLAEARGTTPQARALGARLVKDHGRSLKDAIALAHRLRVEVPKTPSPSQEWELDTVAAFTGAEFDHRYAELEVQDHKQDIDEAKAEVSKGSHRAVRANARGELPALRAHLKLSREALAAVVG